MTKPLNYRRRLLAIVDALMDPSTASHGRAHRLIKRLYQDPRRNSLSIDDLVWHWLLNKLSDVSLTTDPQASLREIRETLMHGSPMLHRAYLSYDYRPDFTEAERDWHARLTELASWLLSMPFPVQARGPLPEDDETTPQAEYERRVRAIRMLAEQTPPPTHLGEETLYHFILRTADATLTSINPNGTIRTGYLVAASPYTEYHWDPAQPSAPHRPPDAGASVDWATHALRAVTMRDWVWLTWQITAGSYLVSLH